MLSLGLYHSWEIKSPKLEIKNQKKRVGRMDTLSHIDDCSSNICYSLYCIFHRSSMGALQMNSQRDQLQVSSG